MKSIRSDIQALRGLAVLMVLLYHADIGPFNAGYLGVDIFFVVSGYLITKLVAEGIKGKDFTLAEFYFRRAKRLLPAAYSTVLVTALAAPWFLNQRELHDFALQVVGANTFTANIVLWQQTGYFDGASDLKPLLHMWSLAIEEQYYMLLPAALLLLPQRLWLPSITTIFLLSLGLCALGGVFKPVATFYLLPTRAWELLVGSMGALLVARHAIVPNTYCWKSLVVLFYPSLACLLTLPMLPLGGRHPGVDALLVCIATLVVILRQNNALETTLIVKVLTRVGDVSYSLYLVHWPIFSLLKNAWVGPDTEIPHMMRIAALILSFALASLLYHCVENPLRRVRWKFNRNIALKTGIASCALMAITPVTIHAMRGTVDFEEIRRINYGLAKACEYGEVFDQKMECSSGPAARVLVWGDSYAMHLIAGLLYQPQNGGVVQATRSSCGPFVGLAPQRLVNPASGPFYGRIWAESCIRFNESVLKFALDNRTIETVVLSSAISQYISDQWIHVAAMDGGIHAMPADMTRAVGALRETVASLQKAGKKVILIAPPPAADFNIGGCLERRLAGRLSVGGTEGCSIPMDLYHTRRASVRAFLDAAETAGVPVVRLESTLCKSGVCETMIDGTMIYRDDGHLSYQGSQLLAVRMNWAKIIAEKN